jgi:MFS family permease
MSTKPRANRPHGHVPRGTVRRCLKISVWDGVFSSVSLGLAENFFVPFALALFASPTQISWLVSFSGLGGALSQWWTGRMVRWFNGRRSILNVSVYAQASVLLLMSTLIAWPSRMRLPFLVILVTAYGAFGGLAGPMWNTLMAKYLPPSKRSGYFGARSRGLGLLTISSGLAAGFFLRAFGERSIIGFSILMGAAGASRFASAYLVRHMYEPPQSVRNVPRGRFRDFRWSMKRAPFWPFSFSVAALTLAANLVGPYFPVYMLKDLKFDYVTFTIATMATNLSMFTMSAFWGRKADEVGICKVFRLCYWLTPAIPALWLVSKAPLYIVCVQLMSGVVWSGFNLSTTNYVFDAVPPRYRMQAISYLNVANGLSLFSGAFLGGHLLSVLPPLFGHPFLTLVLLSAGLRLFLCLTVLPVVPSVRRHPELSSWDMFYNVSGIGPLVGATRGAVRTILRFES